MSKYPSLEKLENIAASLYEVDSTLKERIGERVPRFEVHMFPQRWGSTKLGFDDAIMYGDQAMMMAYTTVFHEVVTETFIVFFGNELAYMVYDPSEIFYADFAKQKLQSIKLAKKLY